MHDDCRFSAHYACCYCCSRMLLLLVVVAVMLMVVVVVMLMVVVVVMCTVGDRNLPRWTRSLQLCASSPRTGALRQGRRFVEPQNRRFVEPHNSRFVEPHNSRFEPQNSQNSQNSRFVEPQNSRFEPQDKRFEPQNRATEHTFLSHRADASNRATRITIALNSRKQSVISEQGHQNHDQHVSWGP